MKRRLLVGMFAGFALLTSVRVDAHHSFTATYLVDKKVTIEGEVVQFQYRNPHSFLYVTVKDGKGEPQRWAIEWGGSGQLRGQNVTIDTVRPGDHVVVTGDPRTIGRISGLRQFRDLLSKMEGQLTKADRRRFREILLMAEQLEAGVPCYFCSARAVHAVRSGDSLVRLVCDHHDVDGNPISSGDLPIRLSARSAEMRQETDG